MGRLTARHGLAFGAALVAGGALALPFASQASTSNPATASTETTATTTTTKTTTTTPKPAPKPLAPRVSSGYVEHVTASSALLKARINPEGLATEYSFQYGPTTAYGSQTPPVAAGSGTQEGTVVQAVTGLEPYTTYHFRVLASSSAGTTVSTDATFTTKKIPLSLTATVTPGPMVFGSPLTLSGTLSGTGNTGVQVVVQANPFPYDLGFHDITSPKLTDPAGRFSFPIADLLQSTRLRAATLTTPPTLSPVIVVPVAVRVSLHVRPAGRRGFVRLYGTVTPGKPGARVAFERSDHGHYVVISGTRIRGRNKGVSRFSRTIALSRPDLYRAFVLVIGGPEISGRSRPVLIR
ncbi:MAG: fibronectin type III domain-containing protein [Solirubrobacterales bacterium]